MNEGLNTSMFWVGAMFAFTPVVTVGTVLIIWWYTTGRKRREKESPNAPVADSPS